SNQRAASPVSNTGSASRSREFAAGLSVRTALRTGRRYLPAGVSAFCAIDLRSLFALSFCERSLRIHDHAMNGSLISIKGLEVHFPFGNKRLFGRSRIVRAVDGVDLDIEPGETLGLVG